MGLSASKVAGAKMAVNGLVDASKTYLSNSDGTYSGATATSVFGYPKSSVAVADNAVYKSGELLTVDTDGNITVQDASGDIRTYNGIPMLSDTDSSGNINNADGTALVANGDGAVVTMIDGTKTGVFIKTEAGNGANGGKSGDLVLYVSAANNSPMTAAEKAKFEAGFKSTNTMTVINGSDNSDGVFNLVIHPR